MDPEKITPHGDAIVVRMDPDLTQVGSIIVPSHRAELSRRGLVLAAGPVARRRFRVNPGDHVYLKSKPDEYCGVWFEREQIAVFRLGRSRKRRETKAELKASRKREPTYAWAKETEA